MIKRIFLTLTVVILFAACCTTNKVNKVADLIGGEWNITSVEGIAIDTTEGTPFLGFVPAENRLYGNTGCNLLMGKYTSTTTNDSLRFTQMGSTRRMCPNITTEQNILTALEKVRSYKVSICKVSAKDTTCTLDLLGSNGEKLLLIKRK